MASARHDDNNQTGGNMMSALRIDLHATLVIAALLAGGCSTVSPRIQPDGNLDLVAQAGLPDPRGAPGTSPGALDRLMWYRAEAVKCSDKALSEARSIEQCRKEITVFMEAAITASNESCASWFEWLIRSDAEATYAKNWVNIAGNSAQALMGLTGDSPTQIAKVALALGLTNAGHDNYRAVFLMSNTLHKVRKSIDTGRKEATDVIRANLKGYKSWDDANEDVRAFHKSCSREAIYEILDAGAGATAYKVPALDTKEVEVQHANEKLFAMIFGGAGEFSEDDMKVLSAAAAKILAGEEPTLTGLPKAARTKYSSLGEKERADFRRWLEVLQRHVADQKAGEDAAAARADAADSQAAAAERVAKATTDSTTWLKEREAEAKQVEEMALSMNAKADALALVMSTAALRRSFEEASKAAQEWQTTARSMSASSKAVKDLASMGALVRRPTTTREIRFEAVVEPKSAR